MPSQYGTELGCSTGPIRSRAGSTLTSSESWWPWYDASILTRRSRPVKPRASRTASSVDSVPLLVKRHCGCPKRRASSSATATSSGTGCAKCEPRAIRSLTAVTTAGWAWPTTITPKPLWKSTYSLPSTSHTWLPLPWSMNTGCGGVSWNDDGTPRGIDARRLLPQLARPLALGEEVALLALGQLGDARAVDA